MKNILTSSVFVAALCLLSGQSFADLTYSVGFERSQYAVVEGGTIEVKVILTEVATGGDTPRLAPGDDDALFSYGIAVDYSSFTGGASGSQFESLAYGPGFSDSFPSSGESITEETGRVSFEGNEDFGSADSDNDGFGVEGDMITPTVYQLELATLTFNAGDLGTETTLQLQDHILPDASEFVFGPSGTPTIVNASEVSFGNGVIVVVPEPTGIALLGMLSGFVAIRRRK